MVSDKAQQLGNDLACLAASISEIAEKIKAELVVLGTIGRTGLSAAFLGNTAEHVIGRLNCDVLAIKPDSFELEQMNNSQD